MVDEFETLCPTQETVREFLSGRLDLSVEPVLLHHLEHCRACQRRLDSLAEDDLPDLPRISRPRAERLRQLEQAAWMSSLKQVLYRRDFEEPSDASLVDTAKISELLGATAHEVDLPTQVGRFKILSKLGAGGFGVVLLAHDPILKRQVALKLPRVPAIADPGQRVRFLREAQAAAGLHHPNIIPVYEAGGLDGLCYITAAYCPGPSLAEWLAQRPVVCSALTAARIVLQLAEGVEHAHRQGVLHRDIKPGNVLLDPRPADELPFTPMLTDFGLAKLLEEGVSERWSDALLGTPRYMAPEQAAGRRESIGPASDVYAVGVVLYELLTKRPPIVGQDNADTLRRVLVEEPLPPRRIVSQIPRDLEAICLKCLEKAPQRRYASAAALAADLTRFLSGESTQARPFRLHERLGRTARRAPAITALVATIVTAAALLIAGLALHLAQVRELNVTLSGTNVKLDEALQSATSEKERASNLLYASDITNAHEALQSGDVRQASTLLARHVPQPGQPDRRGFEWHYLHRKLNQEHVSVAAHASDIYCVGYSPGGNRIVTCGKDGFVRVWDASTLAKIQEFNAQQGEVNSATFSPDGRWVATTGDDGSITIWDWHAGRAVQRVDAAHGGGKTFQAFYLGDGKLLASCGENDGVHFWDTETLSRLPSIDSGPIDSLALSADGRWLATAGGRPSWKVGVWDLAGFAASDKADNQPSIEPLGTHPYTISGVAFSPNGQLLATCDREGRTKVWDLRQRLLRRELRCLDSLHALEFSPDGGSLAVASRGGSIHTWPIEAHESASADLVPESSWNAHEGRVWTLAYSPDGWRLASGGADGHLKLWPRESAIAPRGVAADHTHEFVCIPRTSRLVHAGLSSSTVYDLDAGTGELLPERGPMRSVVASANGNAWASREGSGSWWGVWRASDRKQIARWHWASNSQPDLIQLSPRGDTLAAITDSERTPNRVRLFDTANGIQIAACDAQQCNALAFSPAGGLLAYNEGTSILLCSASTLERVAELRGHGSDYIRFVTFSPNGRLLASAGKDRLVKVWDVAEKKELYSLDGQAAVKILAFSPDGKTLLSGAAGERARLWHVATGQELLALEIVLGELQAEFLDPWRLVFCEGDGRLRVLDVTPRDSTANRYSSKLYRDSTRWTWNAIHKPSNRALFSRAGKQEVYVGKEKVACEQLKVSLGEVDFWLAEECVIQSSSMTPPAPSIDIGQANPTGTGAILRLRGPGRLICQGLASIGDERHSTGTVIVGSEKTAGPEAASWDLDGDLWVGRSGTGSLRIEGGGRVRGQIGYIAGVAGSSGTATVTGAGSEWKNAAGLLVGTDGTGALNIENGGTVASDYGYLGLKPGCRGAVIVAGDGSQWNNTHDVFVGYSGAGSLLVKGGGLVSCRDGVIAKAGSYSWVIITGAGSRWSNSGNLYVSGYMGADGADAMLEIRDGGQVTVDCNVQILRRGSVSVGKGGTFNVAGTIANSYVIEVAVGGEVSAESVSNPCIITNNGTLTGDVTNLPEGDVRGCGLFNGTVTISEGSNVQPGKWEGSPGTMRGKDFLFAAGARLFWEINPADGGAAGTDWDLLSLTGTLKITATAEKPIQIQLFSRDPVNAPGPAAKFDSSRAHSWRIVTADDGIAGFASDKFKVDSTDFRSPQKGGYFSISQRGNELFLNFTPGGAVSDEPTSRSE